MSTAPAAAPRSPATAGRAGNPPQPARPAGGKSASPILTRSAGEAVVATWRRWDEHCSTDGHYRETFRCSLTDRMEDACQELAERFGFGATAFRNALTGGRRAGLSYADALRSAIRTTPRPPGRASGAD